MARGLASAVEMVVTVAVAVTTVVVATITVVAAVAAAVVGSRGSGSLAGNVAKMSVTCRPDTRCCSNFGQMGPCCR